MSTPAITPATETDTPHNLPALVRLWCLRIAVPMRGYRQLITDFGFLNDRLAAYFGLDPAQQPLTEQAEREQLVSELKTIHLTAECHCDGTVIPDTLGRNIERMNRHIHLDDCDRLILAFAICLKTDPVLEEALDMLGKLSPAHYSRVLATILGLDRHALEKAISPSGTLFRSGLLRWEGLFNCSLAERIEPVSMRFAQMMVSLDADPLDFLSHITSSEDEPEMRLADFTHLQAALDVLLPTLSKQLSAGERGVNILLYGPPGTGKTQLARVLASHFQRPLYSISSVEDDGSAASGYHRMQPYCMAQALLGRQQALILFDEADDLFQPAFWAGRSQTHSKHRINRLLEDNPVPTLWVTNSPESLDPAYIRRFSFCISMDNLPRQKRQQLIRQYSGKRLSDSSVAGLAAAEQLSPAILRQTLGTFCQAGESVTDASVEAGFNGFLRAMGQKPLSLRPSSDSLPPQYDPALLNMDADREQLIEGLREAEAGRLLFYGPPGTGKTAFAQWLADRLARPLHYHKASTLLSKWVGESENNIARAFDRAEQEAAILLLDEVDTFLGDRHHAERQWEVSLVNELLTSLASSQGMVIACTNLPDRLDGASQRRFDLQIRFGYLYDLQARQLLDRLCELLHLPAPDQEALNIVAGLDNLTPGDFEQLRRRHRLQPLTDVSDILTALGHQVQQRSGNQVPSPALH